MSACKLAWNLLSSPDNFSLLILILSSFTSLNPALYFLNAFIITSVFWETALSAKSDQHFSGHVPSSNFTVSFKKSYFGRLYLLTEYSFVDKYFYVLTDVSPPE